jgi:hypothetical protein
MLRSLRRLPPNQTMLALEDAQAQHSRLQCLADFQTRRSP